LIEQVRILALKLRGDGQIRDGKQTDMLSISSIGGLCKNARRSQKQVKPFFDIGVPHH
jgi:hypothetical protein